MILERGRVCVKVKGRDTGSFCVVVTPPENGKVTIVSQKRKKPRKCSLNHLEPTMRVVTVFENDWEKTLSQL